MGKDLEQLNSDVIRVFNTRYSLTASPTLDEIINDKVAFYAHTIVRVGINLGGWEKVGTGRNLCGNECSNILFGTCSNNYLVVDNSDVSIKFTEPKLNWRIWTLDQPARTNVNIENFHWQTYDSFEFGAVVPYIAIHERVECGYYLLKSSVFDIIKRSPWPEFNSYVIFELDNKTYYLHYLGENLQRIIVVCGSRKYNYISEKELSKNFPNNPFKGKVFGDINWRKFITSEEFEHEWSKPTSHFLSRFLNW